MERVAEHTRQGRATSAGQMAGKNAVSCKRLQPKLTVNTPGDAFEQQADAVAARVVQPAVDGGIKGMRESRGSMAAVQPALMRATTNVAPAVMGSTTNVAPAVMGSTTKVAPAVMRKCAKCEQEEKLQRKESEQEAPTALRQVETDLKHSQGEGRPLPAHLNALMSRRIGADFSAVRIHTGARAHGMNKAVKAKAFAYGKDIYFREGQYDPDSVAGQYLLAHELTHVVQQGHAPLVATDGAANATPAGVVAAAPAIAGGKAIHRFSFEDAKNFLADHDPTNISIEDVVSKFMPGIVMEIKQAGGILPWLEKKVTTGLDKLLNAAVGPVKDAVNFISNLSPTMARIITWIQGAGAKIARNDCSSFTELAEMVEKFVDELTAPAIEKIKELASTASAWCKDLWQKFGVPVWDFIKKYVGDQWEAIKSLGSLIWEKSKPIRDWAASVWVKFKNWLGIGDGPEGENGILQWVEGKITSVWDTVKAKIEPFKTQLMVIGGVMVALSPAGPLIAVGGAFALLISAVNWYRKNIHSPEDIVKLRVKFEKEILPSILQGINKATGFLQPLFAGLISKFTGVAGAMGKLVGMVSGSIISFIQSAVQWISDGFNRLVTWASEGLASLSHWLSGIFEKVRSFVIPIIQFFEKVSTVVDNIMQLPMLIAGALWKKVPACIRQPVENFLLNSILKNVPFFEDVVTFVKYWQKIKAGVIDVVKTVFIHGDLKGAIIKAFRLLLDVLEIPEDLVISIYNKAVESWETIVNKPKVIFGNIVQSIKIGFNNFKANFVHNAIDALGNWLFSKVKGVKMPKEYTVQSVFGIILDILGLTEDNIFKHIEKKSSKEFAENLRKAYRAGKAIVKWVIDIFKDPKAAYEKMKDKVKEMKETLFESIGKWIATEVIGVFIAKETAALATTPFGPAIDAIVYVYKMIKTAQEYMARILRIVNGVLDSILDLASGKLDTAVTTVEKGLVTGLEIAVAFIAKVLSIGDAPVKVQQIVEKDIRPIVDKGIDVVADLVVKAVQAVGGALGLGKKEEGKDKEGEKEGDQRIEQTLEMSGRQHRLIVEIKNGEVRLLIASEEQVLQQVCQNAISKFNVKQFPDEKEREAVQQELKGLYKEVADFKPTMKLKIEKIRSQYHHSQHRDRIDYTEIVTLADLRTRLINFGARHNIKEIEGLYKNRPPGERRILKSPESLRKCYGSWASSSFFSSSDGKAAFLTKVRNAQGSESQWQALINDYVVVQEDSRKDFDFSQKLHVDHNFSAANHWSKGYKNVKGNDTDDATRNQFMNDRSNLRVITERANLKKAKEKDGIYAPFVGPNFNSILEVRKELIIEKSVIE